MLRKTFASEWCNACLGVVAQDIRSKCALWVEAAVLAELA